MARVSIFPAAGPQITAPAGIWFEATDIDGFDVPGGPAPGETYDPSFHDITYVWTVSPGVFEAFDGPDNMVPAWNDPSRAYGRQVAFFFPKPGTYEIALWARDGAGNEARATYSVSVADPNSVYPGDRTLYVSFDPGEGWDGAPSGGQFVDSAGALGTALAKAKEPLRVLFKRGQTFSLATIGVARRQLGQVDAWGQGALPVLISADGQSPIFEFGKRSQIAGFTAANLAFQGDWDSTTETGYSTRSPLLWTKSQTPCHYAVWNCHFSGFDHLDFEQAKGVSGTVLMGNSHVTNWRNFGFLLRSPDTRFGVVGTAVAQHPDALHGGPKRGALWNTHGPIRIADCAKVYIGMSDFFSRTGWSGLAGELADQPCLRLNTTATRGNAYNLDRIVCEGGFHPVSFDAANERTEEQPGNYVIDKALMIGSSKTIGPFIVADLGGVTARNMIGVLPDTPRKHPNRWQGVIRTNLDNPSPDNIKAPATFYGISALNLLGEANAFEDPWEFYLGRDDFANHTLENVVLHEAASGDDALDLSTPIPGITPRYRGIRYGFSPQTGTLAAAIGRGAEFRIPYTEITRDQADRDGTAATDQAYWAGLEPFWHMLWIKGVRNTLYAAAGDFTVAFGAADVTITNTGRKAWPAEAGWMLKLDRRTHLPAIDTRFANPATVPLPMPRQNQLKSLGGAVPLDDFFGRPRGADPSMGAIEPK